MTQTTKKGRGEDPLTRFEAICSAMADPTFYPHPVTRIERRDTHISAVFLTGALVYKLKKPLDLGFLDFRRLEDRRAACLREVDLNRRLSRNVYREVVSIHRGPDGTVSLIPCGPVIEYAVMMRQLLDAANLRYLLETGGVGHGPMAVIGRRLARFYEGSERSPAVDAYGSPDAVAYNMEENFRQLAPWVGAVLAEPQWTFLCKANRAFLADHTALFQRRIDNGRIRDGHGDLRADHVYFDDGLQIIDCIEFNDRFRYGDAAVDIAFLVMDMAALGHAALGYTLLAAYAAAAADPGVFALIDFYVAYRAVVRVKVTCMRLSAADAGERAGLLSEIGRYMDLAYRHTRMFSRPTLWVCCGLPASGKSSLADRLGEAMGIRVFSSDRVRKAMDPAAGVSPYGKGAYSNEGRSRVYGRLLTLAQDEICSGRSAILDATYGRRCWRDGVRQLASDMDAGLIFAECVSPLATLRCRLTRRDRSPGLSDARPGHLHQLSAEFEALTDIPPAMRVSVDTDGPREDALLALLKAACSLRELQIAGRSA